MTLARPMRPRFRRDLDVPPEVALARLKAAVRASEGAVTAVFLEHQGHADLRVCDAERHTWSPCLAIDVKPSVTGSTLHGLVGPSPSVWTLFAFLHFTAATAGTFGLVWGWSQWTLGDAPTALWTVPLACLVSAGAYGGALFGQRLARTQTEALHAFLERALAPPAETPDER